MSEYFETEDVVKGYDSSIVRRILSYLKPYRALVFLTLTALILSTLGELFIPVLTQRVIDDAIMARFITLDMETFQNEKDNLTGKSISAVERFLKSDGARRIGAFLLLPQNQNTGISGDAESELVSRGILLEEEWYAFPLDGKRREELEALVNGRSGLFIKGEGYAAIKRADLSALPESEITLIRTSDIAFIIRAVIFLLFILCFVFIFTFVQVWTTTRIGQEVMKDMRLELFRKTAGQSTSFLSRHPVGRIVTRLTGDVETINEFFSSVLVAFLKDLSIMAGVFITLFILSPRLALVTLITIPPVLAVTAVSRFRARDAFRRQRTASSRVNAFLSERLSGVQVVQLFLGEKKSAKEFAERNRELLNANLGEMYVFATFRPIVEWLSVVTVAAVITAGGNMVLGLSLSLGVLIAFINLIGMFYNPVMDIAEKYTLLQSAMAGGERVFKLLDTDETIPNRGIRKIEGPVKGSIVFEDVHFSYRQGEEILKGLSFSLNPGEMAAIVGYTGAGKTTITNVFARLWDIDRGRVLLDGIPITELPLDELRRAALPVLQDVFLFSGTVAENICLGLPLSEREVEEAARAVYAHEFISGLKDGYRTRLSEGAANISSGQRQLISFARVIAHNPAIVILDEATSSIDTETERLIQLGMRRMLAGRTSIVIAHRLSTIRHADRILVLSDGRVAEEGRHDELIRRNGLYAGLYRLQYEEGGADNKE
ncbi:MAG: ABC transporter ATP-binding protein/permease [Treponema sp.]|nr:ABC transporter ATP-binding protein/permease [Treponema sp.]